LQFIWEGNYDELLIRYNWDIPGDVHALYFTKYEYKKNRKTGGYASLSPSCCRDRVYDHNQYGVFGQGTRYPSVYHRHYEILLSGFIGPDRILLHPLSALDLHGGDPGVRNSKAGIWRLSEFPDAESVQTAYCHSDL